jgi:lysophospholipase L1-like esterase
MGIPGLEDVEAMNSAIESRTIRRSRATVPAAALAVSLAITALVAEVSLRIYSRIAGASGERLRAYGPFNLQVVPMGQSGYRQKPGARFRYANGTVATANRMGFRGPEVARAKPPGVIRVVLLGGSTTHGWGVDDDHTIDAHLRRLLSEQAPQLRVEVVNAAFDGYDSYQILERVRSDVLRLDPDILIVNKGINDVRHARFQNLVAGDSRTLLWAAPMRRLRQEQLYGASLWTLVKHYSFVARFPGFLRHLQSERRAAFAATDVPVYPDAAAYFEQNLSQIGEIALRHGLKVVFSTPPSALNHYHPSAAPERSYWINDARTTQAYRDTLAQRLRRIAEAIRARGGEAVYVAPAVDSLTHFLDDAHLTSEGNRRVASVFAQAVVDLVEPDPQAFPLRGGAVTDTGVLESASRGPTRR